MNSEITKIQRYLDGQMLADEKLAFDSELGLDPFLADAVDGFRSDPHALHDLPVFRSSVQLWEAVVGLGSVLLVFLFVSQLSDIGSIRKAEIKTPPAASIMVVENLQPEEVKPTNGSEEIRKEISSQEVKTNEEPLASSNSESALVYLQPETIAIRETKKIKKPITTPKIHRISEGTYILDLKVAKPIEKPSDKWRFQYGKQNLPAQFENEESFHFNTLVASRYSKVENSTYSDSLTHALDAFKKEDYKTTLMQLEKIKEGHPDDLNVLFYSGLSNYHLGEFEEAISCFSQTANASNAVFAPESEWYLALSLWKSGHRSEAQTLFMEISAEGGFYAERAEMVGK